MPDSATSEQLAFLAIAQRPTVSRASLRRELGMTASALDRVVRVLERQGLVRIDAKSGTLSVNPDFGRVVGIDMGASNLRFALADFCGDILAHVTQKVRPEDGPVRMIAQIKEGIRRLTTQDLSPASESAPKRSLDKGRRGQPLALAIGVPSPVDPRTGLVAFANNLRGWKNVDLRRALEKEFRVPVSLENDANMAAIGEHWRGVARDANHFVFLALGTGIGSGIFTNGKLYRGRTGNAGELFRLNLEWPRWDEDFGDLGYFESQVSGLGIAAAGRKILGPPAAVRDANLADERDARFVFEAARQGNAAAQGILDKAFTMMGVAVADLVAILDPDLIVFGGGVTNGAPELLLDTVTRVARRIQPQAPPIKLSALKDKAQTHGAIFSALSLAYEAIARHLGS
jgi:predicted NBD/HSP70 family sugar kinase